MKQTCAIALSADDLNTFDDVVNEILTEFCTLSDEVRHNTLATCMDRILYTKFSFCYRHARPKLTCISLTFANSWLVDDWNFRYWF